ncbi:MAG: branched-chain amino acid ABC transporter permease [Thermoleophilia bacterium]|nr:branched-chain amino acid ABC transporter permease [Thermoleophilia bacterium]
MIADWIQLVVTGFTMGAIYSLIGLGYVTTYRTSRIINMAQGSFVMMGGYLAYTLFSAAGVPYWPSLILSVVAVVAISVAIYLVVLRWIKSFVNLVLATIGFLLLFEGIALVEWGPYGKSVPAFIKADFLHFGGVAIDPQTLWVIGLMIVIAIALHIFGTRTRIGKQMTATATDPDAARMCGISTKRMIVLAFAISAAVGAIGGVAVVPMIPMTYQSGGLFGLVGMVGAILGGWGSSIGALVGGIVIGVIQSLVTGILPGGWQTAVAFGVLILLLYFRPQGLLGTTMTEGEV